MASTDKSSLQKIVDSTRTVMRSDLRGQPQKANTVRPASPVTQFAKCTSTTADANGHFPAVLELFDPTKPYASAWSDQGAIVLAMPNNETPSANTRYGCRFQGYDASGNAVYAAVGGAGAGTGTVLKCTGTTPTNGHYPAVLELLNPTSGQWSDGAAVAITMIDGSVPTTGTRYLGAAMGSDGSTPVYAADPTTAGTPQTQQVLISLASGSLDCTQTPPVLNLTFNTATLHFTGTISTP